MSNEQEQFNAPRDCDHVWQPISMVFETQILDEHGRVEVRQPDVEYGKVYFICQRCACHTYMSTQWVGHRLYGSEDVNPRVGGRTPVGAGQRPAWMLPYE